MVLRGHCDLVTRYPQLARAVDAVCEAPPWCVTGLSGLLSDDEGLWFELAKPKHWVSRADGSTEIGLGAIGGSLEPGESLDDCWRREAWEEIGVIPELFAARETVLVYEEHAIHRVPCRDEGAPLPALLTVSANRYSRARLPGCATLAIVTYWGRLRQPPRLGDLYGLVRLPRASLIAALQSPELSLAALLALPGVTLLHNAPLPARAVVRPVWTVRSLQLALQNGAIELPEWR
jgi:hypothetical protein